VERLAASEEQLKALARQESELKADTERLKQEIEARIKALGSRLSEHYPAASASISRSFRRFSAYSASSNSGVQACRSAAPTVIWLAKAKQVA
jgi:DNA repair exonuclease SbcCD ATPase subunit